MTDKELFRMQVIQQVGERLLTQVKAAEILNLTDRQVRNLLQAYQALGVKGLVSKRRGKRSNRALDAKFEDDIISLVSEKYEDFGPTLAQEKLTENHKMTISVETLRNLIIKHQLHIPMTLKGKVHFRDSSLRNN